MTRGEGRLAVLLLVVLGLLVAPLGLGCGKDAPPPVEEVPLAAPKEPELAETLAELVKAPRARPPRDVQSAKNVTFGPVTAYAYEIAPARGMVLMDVMDRTPGAFVVVVNAGKADKEILGPKTSFALRVEGRSQPPVRWYEITKGPLAGSFLLQRPRETSFEVQSVEWITGHDQHDIGGWLCHEGRVPGVTPKKTTDLELTCQAAVKAKLSFTDGLVFSPSTAPPHEIRTFANCTQAWQGWAEADTPWGRSRRAFACSYEPRKAKLSIYVDGT